MAPDLTDTILFDIADLVFQFPDQGALCMITEDILQEFGFQKMKWIINLINKFFFTFSVPVKKQTKKTPTKTALYSCAI